MAGPGQPVGTQDRLRRPRTTAGGACRWRSFTKARPAITESVRNVRRWARALFGEPTPLAVFSQLEMPVLYMTGKESPVSSLGVARLLVPALPRVRSMEFEGLGHMGPITHPDIVNTAIARYLEGV